MTEVRRLAQIAMLERRLTFRDLERLSGLKCGTIKNILSGSSSSKRAQQAITDSLQSEIWPGVRISKWLLTLPAGLEIELDTEADARSCEEKFRGFVKRRGAKISFIQPIPATISEPS